MKTDNLALVIKVINIILNKRIAAQKKFPYIERENLPQYLKNFSAPLNSSEFGQVILNNFGAGLSSKSLKVFPDSLMYIIEALIVDLLVNLLEYREDDLEIKIGGILLVMRIWGHEILLEKGAFKRRYGMLSMKILHQEMRLWVEGGKVEIFNEVWVDLIDGFPIIAKKFRKENDPLVILQDYRNNRNEPISKMTSSYINDHFIKKFLGEIVIQLEDAFNENKLDLNSVLLELTGKTDTIKKTTEQMSSVQEIEEENNRGGRSEQKIGQEEKINSIIAELENKLLGEYPPPFNFEDWTACSLVGREKMKVAFHKFIQLISLDALIAFPLRKDSGEMPGIYIGVEELYKSRLAVVRGVRFTGKSTLAGVITKHFRKTFPKIRVLVINADNAEWAYKNIREYRTELMARDDIVWVVDDWDDLGEDLRGVLVRLLFSHRGFVFASDRVVDHYNYYPRFADKFFLDLIPADYPQEKIDTFAIQMKTKFDIDLNLMFHLITRGSQYPYSPLYLVSNVFAKYFLEDRNDADVVAKYMYFSEMSFRFGLENSEWFRDLDKPLELILQILDRLAHHLVRQKMYHYRYSGERGYDFDDYEINAPVSEGKLIDICGDERIFQNLINSDWIVPVEEGRSYQFADGHVLKFLMGAFEGFALHADRLEHDLEVKNYLATMKEKGEEPERIWTMPFMETSKYDGGNGISERLAIEAMI